MPIVAPDCRTLARGEIAFENQYPGKRVAGATGLQLSCKIKECDSFSVPTRPKKTLFAPLPLSHLSTALTAAIILLIITAPGWGQPVCASDGRPLTLERLAEGARLVGDIARDKRYLATLTERLTSEANIAIMISDGRYPGCSNGCLLYEAPAKEFGPHVAPLIKQNMLIRLTHTNAETH